METHCLPGKEVLEFAAIISLKAEQCQWWFNLAQLWSKRCPFLTREGGGFSVEMCAMTLGRQLPLQQKIGWEGLASSHTRDVRAGHPVQEHLLGTS